MQPEEEKGGRDLKRRPYVSGFRSLTREGGASVHLSLWNADQQSSNADAALKNATADNMIITCYPIKFTLLSCK